MEDIQLVIFDCDGVLVDSELTSAEVFGQILREECQLELSLEQMLNTFVGRSAAQCQQIVAQMLGKQPPEQLMLRYNSEINAALAKSVVAVSGIEQLLQDLSLPCCVASGGSFDKMHTTLGKTGLLRFFPGRLFSASQVPQGKPAPDLFLFAAQQMGVEASRCLVIEDSPTGIKAARAAGMQVFGYCERMPETAQREAGAQWCFSQMRQLAERLL